jgi:hypothetical protein
MKEVVIVFKIAPELAQYFMQKTFFLMLINYRLNKKRSKIGENINVNNSSIFTYALQPLGL